MPALATIDPPNGRSAPLDSLKHGIEPKKKAKASSLCYTPPAMINDKKRDRSYFRRGLLGEVTWLRGSLCSTADIFRADLPDASKLQTLKARD